MCVQPNDLRVIDHHYAGQTVEQSAAKFVYVRRAGVQRRGLGEFAGFAPMTLWPLKHELGADGAGNRSRRTHPGTPSLIGDGGPQALKPILKSAVERIEKLFDAKGNITGVSTGFKDLDEMTSGLQQSDLVIVAGRPSMGKTTFAMNMVETAVLHNDKPVLVFSLEMPADSLVIRMLSSIGRIDQTRMRNGKLEDEDWDKLSTAMTKLRGRPLFIDDTSGLSPSEMRSRARRIAREHGQLGLIMVDYLQLMQIKGSNENRTGEISEISRSLKLMAREFNCPVVALSQLNRSLEQRPNKRPVMSDLRESGAIEQDADIIMFVYRDEVYNPDKPEVKGVAEIIIGKQRNGPIGMVNLSFIGKHTRFENFMPMNGMQPKGEWGE